jgi:hypothetical protein
VLARALAEVAEARKRIGELEKRLKPQLAALCPERG